MMKRTPKTTVKKTNDMGVVVVLYIYAGPKSAKSQNEREGKKVGQMQMPISA